VLVEELEDLSFDQEVDGQLTLIVGCDVALHWECHRLHEPQKPFPIREDVTQALNLIEEIKRIELQGRLHDDAVENTCRAWLSGDAR